MTFDFTTRVTGAHPVGISDWLASRRTFRLRSMVERSSMVAHEKTNTVGNIGALSDDGAGNQT